jgi:hypothetical protein
MLSKRPATLAIRRDCILDKSEGGKRTLRCKVVSTCRGGREGELRTLLRRLLPIVGKEDRRKKQSALMKMKFVPHGRI